MTIPELIAKIKELDEKAIKGPLRWKEVGDDFVLWGEHGHRPIVLDAGNVDGRPFGKRVLRCNVNGIMRKMTPDHPDMQFIAAARELLPLCGKLIEAYERWTQTQMVTEDREQMHAELAAALEGKHA